MDILNRFLKHSLVLALPLALATGGATGCEGKKKKTDNSEKNDKKNNKKGSKGKKGKKGKKGDKEDDKKGKKGKKKGKKKDKKSKGKKGKKKGKKKSLVAARTVGDQCVGKLQGCWGAAAACEKDSACETKATTCFEKISINCLPAVPENVKLVANHGWIKALAECKQTPDLSKCSKDYDACATDTDNEDERLCFATLEECVEQLPAGTCSFPDPDSVQRWVAEEDSADEDEDESDNEDENDDEGDEDEDEDESDEDSKE